VDNHPARRTRDVRLDVDMLDELIDSAKRRRRELRKRNERMDGSKPGMMLSNDRSIDALDRALGQLEPARAELARQITAAIKERLNV
jgi:hypothetical protein